MHLHIWYSSGLERKQRLCCGHSHRLVYQCDVTKSVHEVRYDCFQLLFIIQDSIDCYQKRHPRVLTLPASPWPWPCDLVVVDLVSDLWFRRDNGEKSQASSCFTFDVRRIGRRHKKRRCYKNELVSVGRLLLVNSSDDASVNPAIVSNVTAWIQKRRKERRMERRRAINDTTPEDKEEDK